MTVIEGSRQVAARSVAERAFTTAMDAVLAGFYGPLMDEYHLLGLDISYGNDGHDDSEISRRIKDYMSYTFDPPQNSEAKAFGGFYGISVESVTVKNKTKLMDYGGSLFVHEISEYMKYKTMGNAAQFLLEKASLLEQPKQVSILYEEKLKVEEEMVDIDEGILALMKYLDGVSTGKKGLVRDRGGKLKTEKYFAKKILFDTPTMESTGINNQIIFLALQDQYINPSGMFEAVSDNLDRLIILVDNIADEEARETAIQGQIEEAKNELAVLKNNLNNMDEDDENGKANIKARINDIKNRISDLEEEIRNIRKTISDYENEKNTCLYNVSTCISELGSLISGCISRTEQSIEELDKIIAAAQKTEPKIISFENNLKKYKDVMDKEIYDSFEESLKDIKKYLPENNHGYDFLGMKEILESNYDTLRICERKLNEGYEALSGTDYAKAKDKYNEAYNMLLTYNTGELKLDYSTLVIQNEDTPDFLEAMKDLVEKSITRLVIDEDKVSSKKMNTENLPSVLAALAGELQGFSFPELFKKLKIGNKETGLGGLFGSFDDYSLGSLLGKAADTMAKRILLMEYIDDHFYNFTINEEEKKTRKPSVLDYEREYLLFGKDSDEDNLEAVVMKLILIRTVINFASLLGDRNKFSEAKALAAAMVGFTGLPVLVYITQGILMLLLAYVSALVDTCALLSGKEVPFVKKIELNYSDILLMTGENIRKKAESYKDEKGFTYNDYLTVFLYMTNQKKLSYRMMDLMQENIKLRYGTNFNFQNCIFGFEAEAVFNIKPLFTRFAFIKEHIDSDFKGDYKVSAGYSY